MTKRIRINKTIRTEGADDVYLTEKSIAVRRIRSGKSGKIISDETIYYPKTRENLRIARSEYGTLRKGRY